MLYELILINEIEQRAKIIFLSACETFLSIYLSIYLNLRQIIQVLWAKLHARTRTHKC